MPQFESMVLPPRLPLVVQTQNRDGSFLKDARLVNCYMEIGAQGETWVFKRPGLYESESLGFDAVGRGVYNWKGDVYSIFDGTLFKNGASVPGGSGLDETGGLYTFSAILGATPRLLFGNGKKTYSYEAGGGVTSDLHTLDADFPAATVKGIVYLNGATYVMQSGGQIWGSAVNSVGAGDWNPLNFIAAQIEPDGGVVLAKQQVYVIAMGQWSTEVFFDAGNPTGSPLGPVQGSKISYGCANADSIQRIDDNLFWVSSSQSAAVQVSVLNQLTHQVISTKAIDRLLQNADLSVVYSWQLKISGHSFYVLTVKNSNFTIAYDVSDGQWHQWTDTNGNYIPIVASTYDSSRRHVLQHESNGKLYYADINHYTDDGDKIFVDIYTPFFDANTSRRKTLTMMEFIGDQEPGSKLYVRFSEDDYQTWCNFRTVNLWNKRPRLTNCGTFVRRAYHFRHWANTPLRLQAVDVQYDVGTL